MALTQNEVDGLFAGLQTILNVIGGQLAADPVIANSQATGQPIADSLHKKVLDHIQESLDWSKEAWAARSAGQPLPPLPAPLDLTNV